MIGAGDQFMESPLVPLDEANDRYLCKKMLNEPVTGGFTEDQSLRNLVELLVQTRSKSEARRMPRFLTPAVLSGLKNSEFNEFLSSKRTGPNCDFDEALESTAGPSGKAGRIYGIKIVDFSEYGIQIQFKCTTPFELFNTHLFLRIGDTRIPVTLKWYRLSLPFCRGGLLLREDANFGRKSTGIISNLCRGLVDYLIDGFISEAIPFTAQAGVYAYLAIFYSLRLLFLEQITALKEMGSRAAVGTMSSVPDFILSKLGALSAERFCTVDNGLLRIFMKPYFDFGCGLCGMREDVVFPQQDVRASIINSMFFGERDCLNSTDLLPAIEQSYRRFLELKLLLPGAFGAAEFDNQFRYYNRIVHGISLITEHL